MGLKLTSDRQLLVVLMAMLAILFVLQIIQFTAGVRVTADDVAFMHHLHNGWHEIWAIAQHNAFSSGRIGHFIMTPLNGLGASWAGDPVARTLMVSAYFMLLVLFALYTSQLLARGSVWATLLMLFVMLSLHPLAYEHMPPTAYPLQNTLPFFILISLRLVLLRLPQVPRLLLVPTTLLQTGLLLVNEYTLVLGSAMMATEHLARALDAKHWRTPHRLLHLPVDARRLTADTLLAILTLAIYLGFRLAYPSQYEGNVPDGLGNPLHFFLTAILHVVAGTSVYRLSLDTQPLTLVLALVVGLLTFVALRWILPRLPQLPRCHALIGLLLSGFFALYVTFPLAATSRSQEWCLENLNCGFLDSRSAFLFMGGLIFSAVILLRLTATPQRIRAVALFFALLTAINYAHSQRVANSMAERAKAWDRAEVLACSDQRRVTPAQLRALDPYEGISMHPFVVRSQFWIEYMNNLRARGACGAAFAKSAAPLSNAFFIPVGHQHFEQNPVLDPLPVLVSGWSMPEDFGVWSNASQSRLRLDLSHPDFAQVTQVKLDFRLFWGSSLQQQQIQVWINDQHQTDWVWSQPSSEQTHQRTLDLRPWAGQDAITLELRYHHLRDPQHPEESADPRRLALGLHHLELLEGDPE